MMDMVMAIAIPLARTYGMNKAIEIAYERLGIDKPSSGIMDILTGGGINQSFSPTNFLKRQAVNLGVKSLFNLAPKALGPLAIGGGLAYVANQFNPLNPKARNYNPNLAQEINFAGGKGLINRTGSGLKYGPNSVLSGQNVISMFGTNSYLGQLEKQKNYFEDRISKGKNINQSKYAQTLNEISEPKGFTRDQAKTKNYGPHSGGGGGNGGGGGHAGGAAAAGAAASQAADDAAAGAGGYRRGGIISLYG